MSSRLMPPKVGSRVLTTLMSSSGSVVASSRSKTSTSANILKSMPLPSMTGLPARGPMLPRPSTAVPLLTTATRLLRAVRLAAAAGSASMARQASATPGE